MLSEHHGVAFRGHVKVVVDDELAFQLRPDSLSGTFRQKGSAAMANFCRSSCCEF